jgi:hypothetical protein
MLIAIAIFVLAMLTDTLAYLGGLINLVLPPWLNTGVANVLGGSGWINDIIPLYPHVGMAGLAGQIGFMTMFGWLMYLASILLMLRVGFWAIASLIGILPWHTVAPKMPHKLQ